MGLSFSEFEEIIITAATLHPQPTLGIYDQDDSTAVGLCLTPKTDIITSYHWAMGVLRATSLRSCLKKS